MLEPWAASGGGSGGGQRDAGATVHAAAAGASGRASPRWGRSLQVYEPAQPGLPGWIAGTSTN